MRLFYLLVVLLGACTTYSEGARFSKYVAKNEVAYLSTDLGQVAIFSKTRTRFGPTDLTVANPVWPSFPAKSFQTGDGVQCVSVGEAGIAIQYAVKRPLKLSEQYKCLGTTFRVTECFYECLAAIIEIDRPLSGGKPGAYQQYIYVDNCRGVLILGGTTDLSKGIPLNAEWLRGEVGILAHPDYPKCRSF